MIITDQKIVSTAPSWIGTKFCHQGRIRINSDDDGGCDCIGLVIGIADELKIHCRSSKRSIKELDNADYPVIINGKELVNALNYSFYRKQTLVATAGDIVLLDIAGNSHHVGICSDYKNGKLGLIHAHNNARKVVEHNMNNNFIYKIKALYRFI